MDAPPHNLRPRYNVSPTDPVDMVTAERELVTMRWGLVPWWWSKPLKQLRMATFNARAETVETKLAATPSRVNAVSSKCRATSNGKTPQAASSPGTSPHAMASSCLPQPGFG